jgi:hypothetical protein
MQGSWKSTWRGTGTNDRKCRGKTPDDGKVKWMEKGKGNSKANGIVKHTPGGNGSYCDIALHIEKEINQVDLVMVDFRQH